MSDFDQYLEEQLQDETFRVEYEQSRPAFEIWRANIYARLTSHMTEKELDDSISKLAIH